MSKTILVVDDDPGLGEALKNIFALEGYQTVLANDGLAALDQIDQCLPAVIFLDVVLPGMDGATLVAQLHQRGLRPKIPLVLLTADVRGEEKARQLGADDFVAKPFELDLLLEIVGRLATN